MYLRTTSRRRKDGSQVRYLQLAHNEWDAKAGQAVARVIHSFGREDELDRAAIARLVASLTRVLAPEEAFEAQAPGELSFVDSRPMGGACLLDGLWRRLGIDQVLLRLAGSGRMSARVERVLFALVANRCLAPSSKLAASAWAAERVALPGVDDLDADACYRAMDWLLAIEADLAKEVYWQVADLMSLEVDLLFFDTTSTYFEIPDADPPEEADPEARMGFRAFGHSKDHRPDLPQVVVGMAVTRTGIPIRVWTFPGNTNDHDLIRQAKDDLRDWRLSRVVWVADRAFSSEVNRRHLQRAGGNYIVGEKLRGDSQEAKAALSRQGRYKTVADNLRVKQVTIDDGEMRDRFVICLNPKEEERDRAVRAALLARLEQAIEGSDAMSQAKRADLAAQVRAKAGLSRFLRVTPSGLLRIDRAAVKAEERLDGKFLLRSADPTLSAEDIALGYKQLLEVERAWRDMKTHLDLRPVFHRLEERIRAHVILCWLALLLIRIAELATGDTWRNLRHELDRMHLGTFQGPAGLIRQRTETTPGQRAILRALDLPEPERFLQLEPAASHAA
jgi:hypothetical protein